VNAFFPHARLSPSDVIASWAGLRPLLRPPRHLAPSAASREHRVIESPSGLWTIAGGKLTTYRVMARDVVDRVAARLRELDGRPPGGAGADGPPFGRELWQRVGRGLEPRGPGPRAGTTHRRRASGAVGRGGARGRARDGRSPLGRAGATPASVLREPRPGRPG